MKTIDEQAIEICEMLLTVPDNVIVTMAKEWGRPSQKFWNAVDDYEKLKEKEET